MYFAAVNYYQIKILSSNIFKNHLKLCLFKIQKLNDKAKFDKFLKIINLKFYVSSSIKKNSKIFWKSLQLKMTVFICAVDLHTQAENGHEFPWSSPDAVPIPKFNVTEMCVFSRLSTKVTHTQTVQPNKILSVSRSYCFAEHKK